MKKRKQSIAILLSLAMVLSLSLPQASVISSAEETTEITGTTEDGFAWRIVKDPFAEEGEEAEDVVWITGYTGTTKKITIPTMIEGIPVTGIQWRAFDSNLTITDVVIPEGINYLAQTSFSSCLNLKSVSFPSTLEHYTSAIDDSNSIGGANIMKSNSYFDRCISLTTVTFAEGIKKLTSLFTECANLSEVTLPATVEDLGTFGYDFTGLKKIEIPREAPVKVLQSYAFKNSSSLETLELPDSLETIESYAITEDPNLKTILLGRNIKEVEQNGITMNNALETIIITNPDLTDTIGLAYMDVTIYCPPGSTTEQTFRETKENLAETAQAVSYTLAEDMTDHPLGHQYETVVTKEPTCEETGTELTRCRICYTVEEEKEIPATGHAFREWTTEKEATCTEAGTESRVCTACGETETQVGAPAAGHQYEVTKTVSATTEAEGYTLKTCKVCGDQIKDQITSKLTAGKDPTGDKEPTVGKVTLKKVTSPKKRTMQVQWKKVKGVTGYEIRLGTNKKTTQNKKVVTVKKAATVKKTVKKLKGGKKYFVKIRAYTKYKDGNETKTAYGAWSKPKKVKVKK